MKQKKRMIAMVCITTMCCAGALAGCGDSSDSTTAATTSAAETSTEEETEESASTETSDVIGKVTYTGSEYLTVVSYDTETEVEDYALLDVSTLTEGSITKYIYIDEETEYYIVEDQELVSGTLDDVKTNMMIAETISEDGTQKIIMLTQGDSSLVESAVEEETSDSETEDAEAE